jgi:PAS domain S-box-containing protein
MNNYTNLMGSKTEPLGSSSKTIGEQVWPRLAARLVELWQAAERAPDEPVRIWHAACGDGRESCLLLLLLLAHFGREKVERSITFYATDADPQLVEQARIGLYPAAGVAGFPPELVEAYLVRQKTSYVLPEELRRKIIYGQHDLARDAPVSRLDLLICRASLDGLEPETTLQILAGFHYALKPSGHLFFGQEQAGMMPELFTAVDGEIGLYAPLSRHKHDSLLLLVRSGVLGTGLQRLTLPFERLREEVAARQPGPGQEGGFTPEWIPQDQRLRALVESLTDEIWLCDVQGNLVLANDNALKGVGARDLAQLVDEDGRWLQKLEIYTPDGQPRPREEAPLLRALRGETVRKLEEIVRHLETGRLRHRQVSASPLQSPTGDIVGAVAVVRDITDTKEAEKQLRKAQAALTAQVADETARRRRAEAGLEQRNRDLTLINDISAILNQYLDVDELLPVLRRQLAERLEARAGAIFLCRNSVDTVALRHSWGLPAILEAEYQSRAFVEEHLGPLFESHAAYLWPDLRQADPFLLLGLDVSGPDWQSYACFPLVARGRVEGITCLFSRAPRRFEGPFESVFETLGRQIGVALQNASLYREVVEKSERLQQLSKQVVTVQEEERRRLSRELHDEMGQVMVALRLRVKLVSESLPAELAAPQSALEEISDLIAETMHSMRRLAHDLRPPALDVLGLDELMRLLADGFAAHAPLEVAVDVDQVPKLPDHQTISLYRIVQEALTNTVRHGEAGRAQVTLRCQNGEIYLQIEDDGRGFEAPAVFKPEYSNGIGLRGIWERVEMLGGRMEIISQPGQGTRLEVRLPQTQNP